MKKFKFYIIAGLIVFAGMVSLSYVQNVNAYQSSPTYSVNQGIGLSAETADTVNKCYQGHVNCDGNHTCSLGHENCNSNHRDNEQKNHHLHNGKHHQ